MAREQLDRVAARQHGLFTTAQARTCGLTDRQIQHGARSGRWSRVHRGVYRMAGVPTGALGDLLAAVLACGPGALATHRAAAWLWGLAECPAMDVSGPGNHGPHDTILYRRANDPGRPVVRRGVPSTDPLRTVLDLAALGDPAPVRMALDRGVAAGLYTVPTVDAALRRRAGRGVPGVTLLRTCLHERLDGGGGRTSVLESAMDRLVVRHHLPSPDRQHGVGRYRIDHAWSAHRVAVEVDGWADHSSHEAFRHDRRRQNDLVLAGWTVLRFTWDDVVRRPERVAAAVSAALALSRPA